ncbi:MAG TPA: MerR family transcriptional regulator [Flavilitoribacter sp.]|nr:MerR family transcriptional regulator [Flavilitoribacter sp.]HMQ85980.1 MerR family transcriptional regulator [Flavilitoribacter sp.]
MAVYSIKDLEKLSGIKAHTLRIWEQRYGLITPQRTDTNIRYYEDDDLKYVLNVALLNKSGIKISKIASMSPQEVEEQVSKISNLDVREDAQIDALTLAMMEMDEYKFDRIITFNTRRIGFERTMLEVIYPFLDRLSVLWLTGSIDPVQENFISFLIRQKVIAAIDREPLVQGGNANKFMLYLPEGEKQELSLLFMHYLLKARKKQVIYIGQDISLTDLLDACRIHKPAYIFTMISETFAREPAQRYIDRLKDILPDCELLITGYQVVAQNVSSKDNVHILKSLDQTLDFLASISS